MTQDEIFTRIADEEIVLANGRTYVVKGFSAHKDVAVMWLVAKE